MAKEKKRVLTTAEKIAKYNTELLSNVDMDAVLEGDDIRYLMGTVPELMGISPQTGKLLTSGYGKPHVVNRAILATKMAGAQKVTADTLRWAGRVEEHHVVLMKLLEPFLQGRSVREADKIIKKVSKQLGGRKLGNNPDNLVSLIKELHIKNKTSAHGILKRYYDLQGAKAYNEYDQIVQFPKLHGETVFGRKFDNWYELTNMQDGHSLDMIAKIREMDWKKSADTLTGYLDLTIPRLEGAALASVFLDDTSRNSGYAAEMLERFPEGKKHLLETLSDMKESELKAWSFTDPSRPMAGESKVLTEQIKLHKGSQEILDQIGRYEKWSTDTGFGGEIPRSTVKAPEPTPPKPPTDIPLSRAQIYAKRSADARAVRDQARAISGMNTLNAAIGDGTMALHSGLPLPDVEGMATKAADMAWDFGEKGRDMNLAALDNLRAPMALSEGATVAGKLARKAGALVPFAGAAFDTIDAADKLRRARQDPTFLNNLQATMAVGTVGTSFWNEPTNFALGIGNLGIDVGRGVHGLVTDEEKREEAYNMLNALGQSSFKALGLLKY